MAGDGAGIAGALAAEHRGRLAALQAAHLLGRIDARKRDSEAVVPRDALARAVRGREFFDALYKAPDAFRRPVGDTIVCRCEERAEPDEGVPALRHGPLPGPLLRADRVRDPR
ncbi:hypothetical protein G6F68_020585 [Rhizopus microsporus]|nr:hypothetical protein G6F68_020585 [Rhizopus microsporus]